MWFPSCMDTNNQELQEDFFLFVFNDDERDIFL